MRGRDVPRRDVPPGSRKKRGCEGRVGPRWVLRAVRAGVLSAALAGFAADAKAQSSTSSGAAHAHDRETAARAPGTAEANAPPGPPALPSESDFVRVVDRPKEGELEVVVGPVRLPAGLPHYRLPIQLTTLPIDGWLHGFSWKIRDASGRPLPNDLLHHVNFIDPDHRELFAPIPRRMLAAGRETPPQEMPRLLGYPIESGTRVLVVAMFANPTDRSYDDAYLHVRLRYSRRDDVLIAPRDVLPFYVDVMGPVGPKDFSLPPGRHVQAWEGTPAISGRVMAVGSHLHDYAERIRLVDLTDGKVIYEAEPLLNEEGRVASVPTGHLWWKGGVPIFRDHRYRLEVEYLNPTDRPAQGGGMGALGGIVMTEGGDVWPPLDRNDPDYIADLRNTLEEPYRNRDHGHHAEAPQAEQAHAVHGGGLR